MSGLRAAQGVLCGRGKTVDRNLEGWRRERGGRVLCGSKKGVE